MSDLLNQIDFHQQVLHTTGLGGSVLLMSHKKNDSERYVVKLEKLDQSYNEYFGQCLFSALGYMGIESCLMLFGNKCAGAVRYQSNLRRIYANDISKLSSNQRKSFVALYVLNGLLGNADDGEIYIDINSTSFYAINSPYQVKKASFKAENKPWPNRIDSDRVCW